jgi:hypothetical protein
MVAISVTSGQTIIEHAFIFKAVEASFRTKLFLNNFPRNSSPHAMDAIESGLILFGERFYYERLILGR